MRPLATRPAPPGVLLCSKCFDLLSGHPLRLCDPSAQIGVVVKPLAHGPSATDLD